MKKLFLALALLAASISGQASTTWTFQGKTFNVDTTFHAKVGPGTTTTSLALTGSQRLNVFYTTIDLTNPNVDVRVVKASNGATNQTLQAQQKLASREGAQYFIGTNADFFAGSAPCGSTVVDGSIYNVVNSGFENFWMTEDKTPHVGAINFSGTVAASNGSSHALHGINTYRSENQVIIYQRYAFNNITTAPTNNYGAELTIEPIEGELSFQGTVKYRVTSAAKTTGGGTIPEGGAILAGHGTGKTFVQGLKPDDILTVTTSPACEVGGKVMQMASGNPLILQNGQILETSGALDHLTSNNPRTAVGYSADRKKVILLVVDGRSTSVGCVSKTLAGIMQSVGCHDAMNFDGGGSSCLYSKDLGVRNSPSDGQQRAVVNSVWAVATSPTDNEIAEISFESFRMELPRYAYYTPRIYGYNKYGVLIDTDVKGVQLSCDPALGVPTDDGSVLFANGSGTHMLTATYRSASCSMPVTFGTAAPRMRLSRVLVDGHRDYTAEVVAAVNGKDMALDNSALEWSSSDANVATVDESGIIHGVNNGSATITGTVADNVCTLPVSVQKPGKRHQAAISEDISAWKTGGSGTKNRTLARAGESGFAVTYTLSSTRSAYAAVKPSAATELYAMPDSLRLVINPGDAVISKIRLQLGVPGERPANITYENLKLSANANNVFEVPMSDFVDVNDFISYPITFTSVDFYVGDAVNTTHTITVPEFDCVYTAIKPAQGVDGITADSSSDSLLEQSCVAVGEDLHLSVDAPWSVYTLGGTLVAQGQGSTISTATLPAGLYIITATLPTRLLSAKALLR